MSFTRRGDYLKMHHDEYGDGPGVERGKVNAKYFYIMFWWFYP